MVVSRPSTATASLGRYALDSRPQFGESGSGSRHQFLPYEADINYRSNPNARAGFGPGQRPRPQSYHAQIHQEALQNYSPPPEAPAPIRASVGRASPSDIRQGFSGVGQHPGGPRASSISVQSPQLPATRYVCFQKKPNKNIWKNEWETCDHITMSIAPEETEKQIRRHDEPGKDLLASISRLGKYQIRHLRKHEDKLNTGERDSKNWKWVVSAVGKEKKQSGSSQTFWAIYSREPRVRPTNTSLKPPPRAQTFTHPVRIVPHHEDPAYDGPIVVQSVEIPAPPRPSAFPGARPSTAGGYTSGQYFANDFTSEAFHAPAALAKPPVQSTGTGFSSFPGPQLREINPRRHTQFPGSGPQIREVDSGRATSFSQFQSPRQSVDSSLRHTNRTQPAVEAQNFGYQQPHSAEPRPTVSTMNSMPGAPIHRQQSNRVDQPFQPEAKRSPRHPDLRPIIKYPSPQQEQRHRRSNSMAAPRVRQEHPDRRYNDHLDTGKPRRSTLDLPEYSEDKDKMHRIDRWVESSISGSSGTGTSAVGSGDGGSVVGEYTLIPPPMGKRRDSISTYAGKDYYTNSSAGGLARGRSFNEGARQRRGAAEGYYTDSKPAAPSRRATQDYDLQYENNTQSRQSPRYVGYHGAGRRRSPSRRRSRSRHYGGRDSPEDYEYESADENVEAMENSRVNNSMTRRGPPRPVSEYERFRGLVEFGR